MDVTKERMVTFDVIMDSMTDEELENPRRIGASRIERIAWGAGVDEADVRELLEQHRGMRQAIKQLQGMGQGDMQRMMKRMQQGDGGGGMGGMGPFG
jgi:signal recognition particle subunit SRP54